jgi:hypothetical protein
MTTSSVIEDIAALGVRQLFADPEQYRALRWGTESMVLTPAEGLATALDLATFESWLDCSLLHHPVLSVLLGGKPVPLEQMSSTRVISGSAQSGYADGPKIRRLMAEGATLVVSNLHEWHAPLRSLCSELAERCRGKVGAVAFWTAAGEKGLPVHRDDGHLFVLQVAGSKRWSLYDVPDQPSDWRPGYIDEPAESTTFELRAGEVLYLPEGQAHCAESLDSSSLHVTIAVREPNMKDLVRVAVEACLKSVPDHAPVAGSPANRVNSAGDMLGRLAQALTRIDVAALVDNCEERAIRERGSR